jgi:Secretion system C-terminal sorting domain/AhpC/TSA family
MKYKLGTLLISFVTFLQLVQGQLPAGTTAPDFNVVDINGQSHHLYDVLADNKLVVLEISATWCPPCWSYHQSQALQEFYVAHGPMGDDQARVYWVEGDPDTNLDCLYGQAGCNDHSAGNFVEGTPYPIINSDAIASAYQISYFPTIFVICPNKRSYEIDPISAEDIWGKAQACPVAFGSNNAGIFVHDPGYNLPEICGVVSLQPSFLLTNLGTQPLTDASIFLQWNNVEVQTIHWQGLLPTYGESVIAFNSFPVTTEGVLNTVITSINANAGDEDFTNNYKNNDFVKAQHFDQTSVVLKIRTDDYGKETYWELRDESGNVLEHGGNELVGPNGGGAFPLGVASGMGAYSNNTLIKDTLDLPADGCYAIHFVDAYGDGMCCNYGNGYFKLYNIDDPVTPILVSGQFEAYDRHAFSAGSISSVVETEAQFVHIQVFPNPASDMIGVEFDSPHPDVWRFYVLNILGQAVVSSRQQVLEEGHNSILLPLEGLADGLYFFVATTGGSKRRSLQKFLVHH